MSALELKIPPLALAAVLSLAMWVVAKLAPSLSFRFPGQFPVIATLAVSGILISIAGGMAFRRAQTTVDPTNPEKSSTLVTTGVYRLSRNPMYVGFLFTLAAWAAYVSSPLAFIALPVFVAYMNRFQILPEEQALRDKFGRAFVEYERSTRRWL